LARHVTLTDSPAAISVTGSRVSTETTSSGLTDPGVIGPVAIGSWLPPESESSPQAPTDKKSAHKQATERVIIRVPQCELPRILTVPLCRYKERALDLLLHSSVRVNPASHSHDHCPPVGAD
jgi:hypothetical protein